MSRNHYKRMTIECMLEETQFQDPDYFPESEDTSSMTEGVYSTYSVFSHQTINSFQFEENENTMTYSPDDFQLFQIKIKCGQKSDFTGLQKDLTLIKPKQVLKNITNQMNQEKKQKNERFLWKKLTKEGQIANIQHLKKDFQRFSKLYQMKSKNNVSRQCCTIM